MAPTHSTVGGDEKDGREKICGVVSYQLHRDIEAVSCSGEFNDDADAGDEKYQELYLLIFTEKQSFAPVREIFIKILFFLHRDMNTLATTPLRTIQMRAVRRVGPSTLKTTERRSWRSRSMMTRRSSGSLSSRSTSMRWKTAKLRSDKGKSREGTSSVSDHQRKGKTRKWCLE